MFIFHWTDSKKISNSPYNLFLTWPFCATDDKVISQEKWIRILNFFKLFSTIMERCMVSTLFIRDQFILRKISYKWPKNISLIDSLSIKLGKWTFSFFYRLIWMNQNLELSGFRTWAFIRIALIEDLKCIIMFDAQNSMANLSLLIIFEKFLLTRCNISNFWK